jgi:hypothetical protein
VCADACWAQGFGRGMTKPIAAAGFATSMEFLGHVMKEDPTYP